MRYVVRGPLTLIIFSTLLITSSAFSCDAFLSLKSAQDFVPRGVLGDPGQYLQRVYSAVDASFSTLVKRPPPEFKKDKLLRESARGMVSTVSKRVPSQKPTVKLLDNNQLPLIDKRLQFLAYVEYKTNGFVNVEASAAIKSNNCWASVRFTSLKKKTKEESLNVFALLVRDTILEE